VDLTREELIHKLVVKCSDELIQELNEYEKECELNLPNYFDLMNSFENDLAIMKTNLTKWETEIKHLVVDDNLWKSIQKQSELNLARLKVKYKEVENRMILGESNKAEIESKFSNVLERFGCILGFSRF
jgi:hypothetical protein